MMMIIKKSGIIVGGLSILLLWLFCGVFEDQEFSILYGFVKHRPSFKVFFYSPLGESDIKMEQLTWRKQLEEKAFNEFVGEGGGYSRKHKLLSF